MAPLRSMNLSISFEMLSKPVALPMESRLRWASTSDCVRSPSMGRKVREGSGGLSAKYSVLEKLRSGLEIAPAARDESLYRVWKKVVSSSS